MSRASPTSPGSSPSMLRRLSQIMKPSASFQPRTEASLGQVAATTDLPMQQAGRKAIWLDCDPGHDDAIAMLMAVHHPDLELLGVSTVAGNAGGLDTFCNAVRIMALYRAAPSIPVIRGSDCPLVKQVKVDEGIHGQGGLGGVQCLPSLSSPLCQPWLQHSSQSTTSPTAGPEPFLFLSTLSSIITERINSGKTPIHLAVTGPMTNLALFVRCFPHLIRGIEQVVLMGGAAGVRGNRGALAEFNILNDPEAASIVFNTDIKVVMAGLNVTHQAVFTEQLHDRLLSTKASPQTLAASSAAAPSDLKRMLSSTLTFFAKTYAAEFGFTRGPPVHDMLAIAYIIDPTLFHRRVPSPGDVPNSSMFDADPHSGKELSVAQHDSSELVTRRDSSGDLTIDSSLKPSNLPASFSPKRYRVDVECADGLACGATVVDFWGDRVEHEGWGRGGRNVVVLENLDCPRMWDIFFHAVEMAEAHISSSATSSVETSHTSTAYSPSSKAPTQDAFSSHASNNISSSHASNNISSK